MCKILCGTVIAVFGFCMSAAGTTIDVPGDYPTIQGGINASSNGDTVLVQPGTYIENVNFNYHSIVLGSLFLTTGDTSYIASTIIDGNSSGSVITIDANEDSTTAVTGLTIRNGSASYGGGIYFNAYGATFSHLIVHDNSASNWGGGIYLSPLFSSHSVNIINCTISGNSSGAEGGGIYAHNGTNCVLNISGCSIDDNTAVGKGGGFYSSVASQITNCVFSGNYVSTDNNHFLGGGFYGESRAFTIYDCAFTGNTAERGAGLALRNIQVEATIEKCYFDSNSGVTGTIPQGGAITLDDDENQVVNNNCSILDCVIVNNESVYGGGIYVGNGRNITIDHCLITGNAGTHGAGIGIFGTQNDSLVIDNCTVSGNHSTGNVGTIRARGNCRIRNCIVSGNTSDGTTGGIYYADAATTEYNDICNNYPVNFSGSIPSGLGELVELNVNGDSCDVYFNILQDPEFVDPDTADYHLQANSPCVDAGCPDSPQDPDGTICDMGAYYFNQGGTIIPGGYISGSWNAAGSPYKIMGDITIHADSALNIGPGVEVIFHGIYNLTVNGLLEAEGTETDSIRFAPSDIDGGWAGIRFLDSPESSRMAYCTVSHVGNNYFGPGAITCINSDPVFAHCRISDNHAHAEHPGLAGGIALSNSDAEISWCDISYNKSGYYGGGINVSNSSPSITGCNIAFNSTLQQGGGIYIAGNSSPIITGCAIERDTSNMYGGGISVAGGEVTISDCTIGYNKAYDGGGGISISGGNVSVNRCIFAHNYCQAFAGQGGGVFVNNGTLTADHCTFYGDYVLDSNNENGMEIHTAGSAYATITNNIIYSDEYLIVFGSSSPAIVLYNDFLTNELHWYFIGNTPPGLRELNQVNANGDSCDVYYNIFMEPLFVDRINDDFNLSETSPCIDAGDPDSPYDPDSTIADMGRFYFEQQTSIDDKTMVPSTFGLSQNYPNPFNASTIIKYALPTETDVTIEIFDILGRRIETLFGGAQSAGYHQVIWNAGNVPTGIYFFRIETENYIETNKMVLLK